MISGFIVAIGGFIEALIGLRFILELLGANSLNSFVHWIYTWSHPFVAPFAGIFRQNSTITGPGAVTNIVFDWTALIAFIIIGVIVGIISRATMLHRRVV